MSESIGMAGEFSIMYFSVARVSETAPPICRPTASPVDDIQMNDMPNGDIRIIPRVSSPRLALSNYNRNTYIDDICELCWSFGRRPSAELMLDGLVSSRAGVLRSVFVLMSDPVSHLNASLEGRYRIERERGACKLRPLRRAMISPFAVVS